MIGSNEAWFIVSVFLGSFLMSLTSIHVMANLILLEGSSRRRSANLSTQFALLSATIALIAVIIQEFTSLGPEIDTWTTLVFILVVDGLLVFLLKWWYAKKIYETTSLFSFIIVEWIYILIGMIAPVIINLV